MNVGHRSYTELTAGLAEIERAPREHGVLELIVRRPVRGEREVLAVAELSVDEGLVGDRWGQGKRHRENQLAVMSSRVIGCSRTSASVGRSQVTSFMWTST